MITAEEVQGAVAQCKRDLLGLPGILGVGDGGPHVVVYAFQSPFAESLRDIIPRSVDKVPVKTRHSSKIRLLSLLSPPLTSVGSRTARWRPLVGGISVGHPQGGTGTNTCLVRDALTSEPLMLGCNHVNVLDWGDVHIGKLGDSTLQPGVYDGGQDPTDKAGEVLRWLPVGYEGNLIDSAVSFITAPEGSSVEVLEIGPAQPPVPTTVGMRVLGSGRTSGLVSSYVESVNATVDVEGYGTCRFEDQIILSPGVAAAGDSAMYISALTGGAVGQAFAGNEQISVVSRADHIEQLLGVRFPTVPWTGPSIAQPFDVLAVQLPLTFAFVLASLA